MITDVLQPLFHWISQYPGWALGAVFLVSLAECLAIVGLFVPGTVIMFGIGAIVATGRLDLWPTLFAAAAGAIVGDTLSFWLGHYYRQRLHVVWPFRRYPRLMGRGTDFFHRHGGKSVFLSRFIGPVRPILPAIAGMLQMPLSRFIMIDAGSALLWSPVYILPGVAFGASLQLAAEVAGRLAVLLALLLIVLWFSLWAVRKMLGLVQPHTTMMITRFMAWSRAHPSIRPLAGAMLDPDHPEARGLLVLAAIWLLTTFVFGLLLTGELGSAPLRGLDNYVYQLLQGLRTPWADSVMVSITQIGDGFVLHWVFVAILAWLAWTRHWSATSHWLFNYGAVFLSTQGLKSLVRVPRPVDLYEGISAWAFPSGHAAMSVALFGFLAVLAAGELSPARRWIPYGLATLVIAPVGLSRLYLGAHWLSDVIGGLLLGLGWVALLGIAYRRHSRPPIRLTQLVLVAGITAVVAVTWHHRNDFNMDMARYSATQPVQVIDARAWRKHEWRELPAFRADLDGTSYFPITIQFHGDVRALEKQLGKRGWRSAVTPKVSDVLRWLVAEPPLEQIPILPQVHDGRYEVLRMVNYPVAAGYVRVLRLWNSGYRIADTGNPVLIGNVSRLWPRQTMRLFTVLRTGPEFTEPLKMLERDIGSLSSEIRLRPQADIQQRQPGPLQWNGSVLLIADSGPAEP